MATYGSSPLTRGKRGRLAPDRRLPRLIPAHAGKTELADMYYSGVSAHPRSRGENHATMLRRAMRAGSSPLTRGKLHDDRLMGHHTRLIPAHAGKTDVPELDYHSGRAHPRSRGENVDKLTVAGGATGSSPLTRGKPIAGPC